MQIKSNQQIYAGWNADDAKQFCKDNKFTKEMVKIVDREGQILVIARKDFVWE